MQTILDDSRNWYLEGVITGDGVQVIVIEGLREADPEDVTIGDKTLTGYPITTTDQSRRVQVHFQRAAAWQVVDESYHLRDESEVHEDTGTLHVLSRSAYLDYVDAHHGLYKEFDGPALHYRIWTLDHIVEVIAQEPPAVELVGDR